MEKIKITTAYDPNTLGALLRSARQARGLTLSELGEKMGLSARTLARMETAQSPITLDALFAFCAGCGADAHELLAAASGQRKGWPSAARSELEFARQFIMARYGINS